MWRCDSRAGVRGEPANHSTSSMDDIESIGLTKVDGPPTPMPPKSAGGGPMTPDGSGHGKPALCRSAQHQIRRPGIVITHEHRAPARHPVAPVHNHRRWRSMIPTLEPSTAIVREPTPAGQPQFRIVLQILLTVGAAILLLWALNRIAAVVLLLIAAALFAYVIAPLVDLAQHPLRIGGRSRRLPRAAAIGLVYVMIAGIVGAGVIPPVAQCRQTGRRGVRRYPDADARGRGVGAWLVALLRAAEDPGGDPRAA